MGNGNSKRAVEEESTNEMTESDLLRKKPRLDLDPFVYVKMNEGEYSYRVLTSMDLLTVMNSAITDVQSVILLPRENVRALLKHFKWNKQLLLQRYFDYECDNSKLAKLFEQVGIIITPEDPTDTETSISDEELCEICYKNTTSNDIYSLKCGHKFCVQCWKDYLTSKIMTEGKCEIPCPTDCSTLIEEDTVAKLVTNYVVIAKYNQAIAKSFVELNRCLRWCISPGCLYAIEAEESVEVKPVRCLCGMKFCMMCGVPWHGPLDCDLHKKWTDKCAADSGTSKWISLNSKPCPKCRSPIQKNGGCNHITCVTCRYHFCWVCLGDWDKHDIRTAYNCNKVNRQSVQTKVSHDSLEHYVFYFHRYLNHKNSLTFEKQLYAIIKIKVEELRRHQSTTDWTDSKFLKDAVDILCSCRETLMNTFAFAFYLDENTQSIIFSDNQRGLAIATEALSGYLERNVEKADLDDLKRNVIDMAAYCEKRRKIILEHIYEGIDKNWWKYNTNHK